MRCQGCRMRINMWWFRCKHCHVLNLHWWHMIVLSVLLIIVALLILNRAIPE